MKVTFYTLKKTIIRQRADINNYAALYEMICDAYKKDILTDGDFRFLTELLEGNY